jgi:sortase A
MATLHSRRAGRHANTRTTRPARATGRRNGRLRRALLFVGAVAGVAVMMYPSAGMWMHERSSSATLDAHARAVETTPAGEKQELLAHAEAYNRDLPGGVLGDPYSAAAQGADPRIDAEYNGLLRLAGHEVMARLHIPALRLDLPVLHGTTPSSLENGVGHFMGSSLPVGGARTHTVLSAHSGLPTAALFSSLDRLKEGDTFTITVLDRLLTYRVYKSAVVLPDDVSSIRIEPGKDLVTLVTCTPVNVNTHRLLVHAERVADAPGASAQSVAAAGTEFPWWAVIGVTAIAAAAVLIFAPRRPAPRGRRRGDASRGGRRPTARQPAHPVRRPGA